MMDYEYLWFILINYDGLSWMLTDFGEQLRNWYHYTCILSTFYDCLFVFNMAFIRWLFFYVFVDCVRIYPQTWFLSPLVSKLTPGPKIKPPRPQNQPYCYHQANYIKCNKLITIPHMRSLSVRKTSNVEEKSMFCRIFKMKSNEIERIRNI